MDPQWIKNQDGIEVPYGPEGFRQVVKECYFISAHINTSYIDAQKMTPIEREMVIQFIVEDAKKEQEQREAQQAKAKHRSIPKVKKHR